MALIVTRYAQALFELAREAGIHEQVEAELADLAGVLDGSPELRRTLADPRIGAAAKKVVLGRILGDGVSDPLRRTVLLMSDKGRAGLLADLPAAYDRLAMEALGRRVARVESAVPLDDDARSQLRQRLGTALGLEITLEEAVNEELLGGLRVTIGSRMIDGSLRRRLERLQDRLLRAPLATGAPDTQGMAR